MSSSGVRGSAKSFRGTDAHGAGNAALMSQLQLLFLLMLPPLRHLHFCCRCRDAQIPIAQLHGDGAR